MITCANAPLAQVVWPLLLTEKSLLATSETGEQPTTKRIIWDD